VRHPKLAGPQLNPSANRPHNHQPLAILRNHQRLTRRGLLNQPLKSARVSPVSIVFIAAA
jgi:hypothetical protein